MLFSLSFLPPIWFEWWYQDGSLDAFTYSWLLTWGLGLGIWLPFAKANQTLRSRDGFLIVCLFWSIACLVATLPLYLSAALSLSFIDALFEATSGLTTTGATILTQLDGLPHSILYYRQQLQFLGGAGIIILAVAILPILKVAGMQLFQAETTGLIKDHKLTPQIAQTAKAIWKIYSALTLCCGLVYWLGGMSIFDAISYSFSTVSTGGFAPHDLSMGYYHSPYLKLMAILFMFLGSINFNLHYLAFKNNGKPPYVQDPELRFYLLMLGIGLGLLWLGFFGFYPWQDSQNLLLDSLFQLISLTSTTGFVSTDFSQWPAFIPLLLLFLGVIGGCAGSTSGGLKMVRVLLFLKQGHREIQRLIHPNAYYAIKLGGTAVNHRVIEAIWGFLGIYFTLFIIMLLLLLISETDVFTAYTALLATFSNIGPGLGEVAYNFSSLTALSKGILSVAMLMGRLEIFTVLVLLSPAFWKS